MKNMSKIKDNLVTIAILIIPFDSFPIYFGSSIYRPVSIFPLFLCFILLVLEASLHFKVKFRTFKLLTIFLILTYISFAKSLKYKDYSGVVDFFITGFLGISSLSVFEDFFYRLKNKIGREASFNYIADLFSKAMVLPLIFGSFQIIYILTHRLLPGANLAFSLVTYRWQLGRVFLTCGEPSWAVIYLILLFYFTVFGTKVRYRNIKLFIIALYILFTLSMYGYLSVIFAIVFYVLFRALKDIAFLKNILLISILFFIGVIFFDNLMQEIGNTSYFGARYFQLRELVTYIISPEDFINAIQILSGTVFVRLMNPMIALMIAFDFPVLGCGGGYYYKLYPRYIKKYFPKAIKWYEVEAAVSGEYKITSRNLFLRLFGECGIFIGITFLGYCLSLLKNINKNDKRSLWNIALLFMVVLNKDSLCYLPFIFILALFTLVKD